MSPKPKNQGGPYKGIWDKIYCELSPNFVVELRPLQDELQN